MASNARIGDDPDDSLAPTYSDEKKKNIVSVRREIFPKERGL